MVRIPLQSQKNNNMENFKGLFEKFNTPEYKENFINENQKQLDALTMDYQLGYYVGEDIVNRFLPTLSTDSIKSNNVIEISDEDLQENKRLYNEWNSTTKGRYKGDDEDYDGDESKWELYLQHNKMLDKKYLPNPLICGLRLIKFNNENEFKDGIRSALWDCDMCSYNIDIENIKIKYEMEWGATIISFQLD